MSKGKRAGLNKMPEDVRDTLVGKTVRNLEALPWLMRNRRPIVRVLVIIVLMVIGVISVWQRIYRSSVAEPRNSSASQGHTDPPPGPRLIFFDKEGSGSTRIEGTKVNMRTSESGELTGIKDSGIGTVKVIDSEFSMDSQSKPAEQPASGDQREPLPPEP